MASYSLVFKKSAAKDLLAIPKRDVARILERIQALTDNPQPAGGEKLSAEEKYRIRQVAYRIIYEFKDKMLIMTVVKVGHRRQIYKRRQPC